jgi:hypothetical protein
MGRYLEMLRRNTATEATVCNSSDCEKSEITNIQGGASADDLRLPERYPRDWRAPMPLRRCGALICRTCHVHSPSPHRENCAFPRFVRCRSRWYWLSLHGAVKCVACATPSDLGLVQAWVLARETGEGDDGWRIPGEILSLLYVMSPPQ